MVAVGAKVELDGNFFRRSPGKTLRSNVRDMLDGLAQEMEDAARKGIAPHSDTGWTLEHTFGYTRSDKTGKRWSTWAAVAALTTGMDEKAAKRTYAAASSIERRFHPFRNVKSAVYRARAVISADLAKDIS